MRKGVLALALATIVSLAFASCATNRDCQGVKHTTLSNGVRI